MRPQDFVQRLEALASSLDDAAVIAFAGRHYPEVAQALTADERRLVGAIMHTARMAVAMKRDASASPPEQASSGVLLNTPVAR